jgi:hypothetical protein
VTSPALESAWEDYRPRAAEHDITPCRRAFDAGWQAAQPARDATCRHAVTTPETRLGMMASLDRHGYNYHEIADLTGLAHADVRSAALGGFVDLEVSGLPCGSVVAQARRERTRWAR